MNVNIEFCIVPVQLILCWVHDAAVPVADRDRAKHRVVNTES